MMLEKLFSALPETQQELKQNFQTLVTECENCGLSPAQLYGVMLSSSYATKNQQVFNYIQEEAKDTFSQETTSLIKSIVTAISISNFYYRFVELAHDNELSSLPMGLATRFLQAPGINRLDFALYALATSIINGSGHCIKEHFTHLIQYGLSKTAIQLAAKITALINSISLVLTVENQT